MSRSSLGIVSIGGLLAAWAFASVPPRPSSFYGAAAVDGDAMPSATIVSAWIGGAAYVEALVFSAGDVSAYRLDVPADDPETPEIEGGRDGDAVVFKIAGVETPETAVFQSGTHQRLDLTTTYGPDLTLTNDDGETEAAPGATLTYTLTARNQGPGEIAGVSLTDTLPVHTTFVSAGAGASPSGGTVAWPPFDLAEGAGETRTVTVRLADPFPVTVAEIANAATATRAIGLDPDPGNDAATDVDAVLHPTPEITIDDVTVGEGNTGVTEAVFTVSLSNATARTVSVGYATADGTADKTDYAAASGILSFPSGITRRSVTVEVRGDTVAEPGETFYLDLRDPTEAILADAQGLGTITDDDVVYVSISEATGYEIDGVTTQAIFAVTLSGASSRTVTVEYATAADGTAGAGQDYEAAAGAVAFAPGERRRQISVPVLDDGLIERSETFFVELRTTQNAVLGEDRGRATILDNDQGRYPVVGTDVLYTEDVDFLQGRFQGLDSSGLAHLQLAAAGCGFRNLWIAASRRGTILKIDTRTGTILGEYATSPDAVANPNPSRTTVALDGSVWAGNRGAGSVVRIGLVEESQCVDRNGNGVIETSAGEGDVLAWPEAATPADECILRYVEVSAGGTRHLSVDRDGNVWVSGLWGRNERVFDLVDGATGEILRTEGPLPCGGYGGLVDGSGVVWSANIHRGVLRWDPSVSPPTPESLRCFKIPNYGLAIDGDGSVWVAAPSGGQVRKIRGDGGMVWGPFSHGSGAAQGLAVDSRGDVWVSSATWGGSRTVGHLKNDGTFVGSVAGVGAGSSGVAVDPEGKIWTANAASSSLSRIDPHAGALGADGKTRIGAVDLPLLRIEGASPYNYSDMTGCQASARTAPGGVWKVIQDAGEPGARWGAITWNTEPEGRVPPGGTIAVEARAADGEAGLGGTEYLPAASGEPFDLVGRFVQVRVTLRPGEGGSTPILSDLRIAVLPPPDGPPPALTAGNVTVFESDAGTVDAAFPVGLSAAASGLVTVAYETLEASATPGPDYTAVSGTLTFAPGEVAANVVVKVHGDTAPEDEELFFLRLRDPQGAVLADALGVATVADDDLGLEPVAGEDVVYTADEDFDRGRLFNTHHDPPGGDQLQLTERIGSFPYLWIAASRKGTLVKIDTRTGAVLGEYATKPGSRSASNPNPSRTTVGLDGSVWAGNRGNGTVIHVGLVEEGQCIDRNGNGVIETSTRYGEVLPWPSGGVENAGDECILHYVNVPSSIPRHVSVDRDGNVWVSGHGGSNPRVFVLLDGQTGAILGREGPFACGGYGGAVDRDGIVWSVRHQGLILRWDPSVSPPTSASLRCLGQGVVSDPYGLALGTEGDVYVTRSGGNRMWRIDRETLAFKTFTQHGSSCAQGLAVDDAEHVWVSSSRYCATTTVGHLLGDGTFVGNVTGLPRGSTGVAVDAAGKIWVAADQANQVFRIDPQAGPVGNDGKTRVGARDLTVSIPGANPYNYSDMTGSLALRNTSPRGTWTVIQDCGREDVPTARARWNEEPEGSAPAGTEITVASRSAATVAGLGGRPFTPVVAGETFALAGRFVEVRATLRPDLAGASPVLSDLEIECVDLPRPTLSIADVTVVESDVGSVFAFFDVTLSEPTDEEVVVRYELAEGSATAGADYVDAAGTLALPPGVLSRPLAVEVLADLVDEPDETFLVNLSLPENATLADGQGLGTILDDDASVELTVAGVTVIEGDPGADGSGTVDAVFELTLSEPSARLIRLDYATADAGGATAGVDYQPVDGYLEILPGEDAPAIAVRVVSDLDPEPDETFLLVLSNASGVELDDPTALGTILDDDGDTEPPEVTVTGVDDGACAASDVTPAIAVSDPNLDAVAVTLDGTPFASGAVVTAEGDHVLVVDAADTAGNRTVVTVRFTIDKTPPAIEVAGVADGVLFRHVVTPVFTAADAHLGEVEATLDGEPFASGTDVAVIGAHVLTVAAADLCGNSSTVTVGFSVGACELYPIALHQATVDAHGPGDALGDVYNGSGPGQFGWLTWAGANDVPTLATSLTPPGDSDTYVNPDAAGDHVVSIGDWIEGRPGVGNAAAVREALDQLREIEEGIVVPVWDEVRGAGGANVDYRTVNFARLRLTDYRLPRDNRISAVFLGYERCADDF